jgi:uncharacterized membrane protein
LRGGRQTIAPRRDVAPEGVPMKMLDKVGGRKFTLAMVASLQTGALAAAGKIDDGVYSAVMMATVAAYLAANAWQHVQLKPADAPPQVQQ